jgi:hypothetical protein
MVFTLTLREKAICLAVLPSARSWNTSRSLGVRIEVAENSVFDRLCRAP